MNLQLPEDVRSRLADEFSFAVEQMESASDLLTQLYFMSAFFGEANRALNQKWSSELALIHVVLQAVHREVTAVGQSALTGQPLAGVSSELPNALTKACGALAQLFSTATIDRDELFSVLARLAELGYASTGNGRYLHLRGKIEI